MYRLLCVTAHPDDEAGNFGGTLLACHERGVKTEIVCLTSGQAATHRGNAGSAEELGRIRRREFSASCELLGAHGEVLDYPDGQLQRQDFYAIVGEITRRIRVLRPHVVITFGSEGGVTAHTDHGMVSHFATAAYQAAPREKLYPEHLAEGLKPWQPQKLYYETTDFTLAERPPISPAPTTTIIELGPERLARKIEAFQRHATQQPLFKLLEEHVRRRGLAERFCLAATRTPRNIGMENDLFAGVLDED